MPNLSYENRVRTLTVLAVLLTAIVGIVMGYVSRIGEPGEYFWLIFPALLALGVILGWFTRFWWSKLDDVQKAGQVNVWYWGGCAGALGFFLWLVAQRAQHGDFGDAAFTMFCAHLVGFAVVWVAWRLRGMGLAE